MGLFSDLCFRLVPSREFPEEEVEEIRDLIEENGGREIDLQLTKKGQFSGHDSVFEASPNNLKFAKGPIVISAHINFPEYAYLADYYISLVQPQWIRQSLLEGRLVPMKPFSPDPTHIFSNCFVSVSPWLSDSDRDTIYGAVAALGGLFADEIAPNTTHYITFNDEHDARAQKIRASPELAKKVKIVLPHWVDDCIKLRRRIPEYAYQFPDPPLLNKQFFDDSPESREQRRKTGLYLSDHYVKPEIPEDCNILKDRSVFLGDDLDLTSRAKSTLIDLITACQGEVVNDLDNANVYIGQYRDGDQYLKAFDTQKFIGNITWIYWMIANEKWSSPLTRLLHYPLPRYGVPKMKHYVIALSNYHDNARIYLEKLIAACGATYTRDLSHRNTHLIAASPKGTKFTAARKWGIHVVNHIWLEESYSTWQAADISLPRFSYIADRLDLNNLIGKTVLVRESLKEQRILEDGIELNDRGVVNDSQEIPSGFFDTPAKEPAQTNVNIKGNTDFNTGGEPHPHDPISEATTGNGTNSNARGPDARDVFEVPNHPEGNEEVPETTVNAATNGNSKEPKRQERSDDEDGAGLKKRKTTAETPEAPENGNGATTKPKGKRGPSSNKAQKATAKAATSSSSPVQTTQKLKPSHKQSSAKRDRVTILLTGFEKDGIERQKHNLSELNLVITDDPDQCQVLVAPKILRTENFLRSLANAEYVVVPRYVEKSLSSAYLEWPPPRKYYINDPLVDQIMENSRKLGRKKLLEDFVICYMGPLRVNYGTFKRIVYSHGCPMTISGSFSSNATKEKLRALNPENVLFVSPNGDDDGFDLLEYIVDVGIDSQAVIVDLDWLFDSILRMALYLN